MFLVLLVCNVCGCVVADVYVTREDVVRAAVCTSSDNTQVGDVAGQSWQLKYILLFREF